MFQRSNRRSRHGGASQQPYVYDRLDPSTKSIRLLRVNRNEQGQIDCTLRTFNLQYCDARVGRGLPVPEQQARMYAANTYLPEDGQPFVAISYTWGHKRPRHTISVNGSKFEVRQNLWQVLNLLASNEKRCHKNFDSRQVPLPTRLLSGVDGPVMHDEVIMDYYLSRPSYLPDSWKCDPSGPWWWIDAICINQDSIEERNHQVSIMSEIYEQAACVVGWLGLDSLRPSLISHILAMTPQDPGVLAGNWPLKGGYEPILKKWAAAYEGDSMFGYNPDNRGQPGEQADEYLATNTVPANQDLTDLLSRAYWNRAWIVQETMLAERLIFCSGQDFFPWSYLACAAFTTRGTDATPAFRLFFEKAKFYKRSKPSLIVSLMTWRFQQCSDLRDTVYATLGLAKSYQPILPDYRQSLEEVFAQVVSSIELKFAFERGSTWMEMYNGEIMPRVRLTDATPFWNSADFLQFCSQLCRMLQVNPSHPTILAAVTSNIARARDNSCRSYNALFPREETKEQFYAATTSHATVYQPTTPIGQSMIRQALHGAPQWHCHPLDWQRDPTIVCPVVMKRNEADEVMFFPLFPETRRAGDDGGNARWAPQQAFMPRSGAAHPEFAGWASQQPLGAIDMYHTSYLPMPDNPHSPPWFPKLNYAGTQSSSAATGREWGTGWNGR